MSLFQELKRRNVFRVGMAYALVAWVLLQIVDFVLEVISAPDWILQVFVLAAAVGLPVALIVSWVFEMTPEGIKRESEIDRSQSITPDTGRKLDRVIIAFLAAAVVILLADRFVSRPQPIADSPPLAVSGELEKQEDSRGPGVADTEKSIAVLPFVNMSPDPDQEFFSDGISEEILNLLVRLPGLKVAGRTSSFSFKDSGANLREIGEKLRVSHILEGSVRKSGDRVRITAQLIQVEDGFHLWSETYDRQLVDIFAVQDEISAAIANALAVQLALSGSNASRSNSTTTNIEAYETYLRSRSLVDRRIDFSLAIGMLNRVNEQAPEFAPAWAENAQAHALSIYYEKNFDRFEMLEAAERLAFQALLLDPNLAAAHSALGDIHRDRSEWEKARLAYLRALELNPDEVEANSQFSQTLWRAGFLEEASRYGAKAASLDPLSWINLTVHASLLYLLGEHQQAWAVMEQSVAVRGFSDGFQIHNSIRMALSDGDTEKAKELIQIMVRTDLMFKYSRDDLEAYRQQVELLDRPADALLLMYQRLGKVGAEFRRETWEIDTAWALYFGDLELAEKLVVIGAEIEKKIGIVDSSWVWYPVFNTLRARGGFNQLFRELKLDEFWRTYKFPPMCRAVGADDFECD